MARIEEIEAEAWKKENFDLVLKCSDRRRKLLGLDAPQKQQILGDEGGPLTIRLVGNIEPDDL